MLIAAGFATRPVLFAAAPGRAEYSPVDDPIKTWTIGNDRIRRTVAFHPETGLLTEQLTDLSTRADFIALAKINRGMAQEFSFLCNGHQCEGANSEFELLNSGESPLPHGKSLTIHLRHKNLPLEVSVIYSVYDGHPAIRKHLVLRNTGARHHFIFRIFALRPSEFRSARRTKPRCLRSTAPFPAKSSTPAALKMQGCWSPTVKPASASPSSAKFPAI